MRPQVAVLAGVSGRTGAGVHVQKRLRALSAVLAGLGAALAYVDVAAGPRVAGHTLAELAEALAELAAAGASGQVGFTLGACCAGQTGAKEGSVVLLDAGSRVLAGVWHACGCFCFAVYASESLCA